MSIKISQTLQDFINKTGSFRTNYSLKKINWFQVGGPADLMFRPKDKDELSEFLKIPKTFPIFTMGVGSNIIIADEGYQGCIIRLGRNFTKIEQISDTEIKVGAACLDLNLAKESANLEIGGLEFLSGIPGGIGGAIKMNAGAYGAEIKDILVQACGYDNNGNYHEFTNKEMNFSYRKSNPEKELIFTHCILKGKKDSKENILKNIETIKEKREATQPIRSKTGGSTFKNPQSHKAWELIDQAGCRGLKIGDAKMSEKHCNFMINEGNATATDLINLGELVRKKVKENSGIELQWEIKQLDSI